MREGKEGDKEPAVCRRMEKTVSEIEGWHRIQTVTGEVATEKERTGGSCSTSM